MRSIVFFIAEKRPELLDPLIDKLKPHPNEPLTYLAEWRSKRCPSAAELLVYWRCFYERSVTDVIEDKLLEQYHLGGIVVTDLEVQGAEIPTGSSPVVDSERQD